MTDTMTFERFCELADAYGGTIARWPSGERTAAMRLAAEPVAREVLLRAGALDMALDQWAVEATTRMVQDRILRTVPAERPRLGARARVWWSGIGIATALAGAAAGVAGVALVAPAEAASESTTSFGDVAGPES